MSTSQRRLLVILCAAVLAFVGCADGTEVLAPPVARLQTSCPTIDQTLPKTLEATRRGQLQPLAELVEAIDASRAGRRVEAVVRALVTLLRELPPEVTAQLDVAFFSGLITDIEPLLAELLAPFLELDPGAPEGRDRLLVFDAAGEFIQTCPEGSLTGVLQLLTRDADVLGSLRTSLKDPELRTLLASFPAPSGSDSSRLGFALFIDTVLDAILSNNFVFDDLLTLIDPFFPVDEPPLGALLVDLRPLLSGEGLATLRTAARCVDAVERTDSAGQTLDGGRLVGGLLYDLLAASGGDLVALIDRLEPLLIRTGDPTIIALLDAVAEAIQSDAALRATLIDLVAFVLNLERVPLLLHGIDALLQAGALGELLALVDAVILSTDCADDPQTLTARMLHAFTQP